MKKKFVIIGASAAGISCANRLRQLDNECEIVCISDEIESPYNKCLLADYMCGLKQEKEVFTLTLDQAQQKNITLMLGKKVIEIETQKKQIVLDDQSTINYDSLLIGVGTSPRMPQFPQIQDVNNFFTFHHLRDIAGILNYLKQNNAQKAVVVGSGLSGLECADALQANGVRTTVVEMRERVLSTHVDAKASRFIQERMQANGVEFLPNNAVADFEIEKSRIKRIKLSDETAAEIDLIVFAIGLQPNLELARNAGIATLHDGIVTDEYMRTSIPDIYAAGDIALVRDQLSDQLVPNRTWPDAMLQGLIAAHSMVNQPKIYPGLASVISSSFFNIKFASCGPVVNPPREFEQIINDQSEFYHLFLVENGYLKGFLLVGHTAIVGKLRQLLLTKTPVTKEQLLSL